MIGQVHASNEIWSIIVDPGKAAEMKGKQTTAEAKTGFEDAGRQTSHSTCLTAAALEYSLGYSLRRAQLATYDAFSAAMEPFEIRPSQFAVLVLIRAHPGLTQSAICSALGIQKTNFVALLDKLEALDLTERRKVGGDRRSSALHLTDAGECFVAKMEAAHTAMEKRIARRLGTKRTRELLATLHEFTGKRSHHS
jgi:DNA-binding MarR family transcriptional regulator